MLDYFWDDTVLFWKVRACSTKTKVVASGPGHSHVTVALLINTSALLCHINTIFIRQKPRLWLTL